MAPRYGYWLVHNEADPSRTSAALFPASTSQHPGLQRQLFLSTPSPAAGAEPSTRCWHGRQVGGKWEHPFELIVPGGAGVSGPHAKVTARAVAVFNVALCKQKHFVLASQPGPQKGSESNRWEGGGGGDRV